MNNTNLTPRPTRSTLRNRRIILDLGASINGSLVGQEGLKGAARQSLMETAADRRELLVKTVGAGLLAVIGLTVLAVL